jgi:hypothetical protein
MTGVQLLVEAGIFSLSLHPDWLWSLSSFLYNGYWGLFPQGQKDQGMKLITYLSLVPRLRMFAATPPLPQYILMMWCLIKHRVNFSFYLFRAYFKVLSKRLERLRKNT